MNSSQRFSYFFGIFFSLLVLVGIARNHEPTPTMATHDSREGEQKLTWVEEREKERKKKNVSEISIVSPFVFEDACSNSIRTTVRTEWNGMREDDNVRTEQNPEWETKKNVGVFFFFFVFSFLISCATWTASLYPRAAECVETCFSVVHLWASHSKLFYRLKWLESKWNPSIVCFWFEVIDGWP